jgi:5'-nucleotidase
MTMRAVSRALLAALFLTAAACAGGENASVTSETSPPLATTEVTVAETVLGTVAETAPPTTEPAEPLRILVTNDDGIDAPGLDALVEALRELPDVEVTVVAPAENQSGTSMNLSPTEPSSSPATTASGYPAIAVGGFPADAVRWALANLDTDFDLVVSGSNTGQNIGDFSAISGTVGAARFGAQQGIPAIAVSQGFVPEGSEIVYDLSVAAAVDWILANRSDYEVGEVSLTSINAPTCADGGRGPVEVPLGTFDGRDALLFDCGSTLESPVDDVDAFANGFVAITDLLVGP